MKRIVTQAKPKELSGLRNYYISMFGVLNMDEELEMFKDGGIMKIKRLAYNDTLDEHQFHINLDEEIITANGCR